MPIERIITLLEIVAEESKKRDKTLNFGRKHQSQLMREIHTALERAKTTKDNE